MKYIECVNSIIKKTVCNSRDMVLFGQNISAGSCLSGLTRGLTVRDGSRIINTQNSENTLTGIGFGLMMGGVSSVFFMKQLDFLLLGTDHLVNTYNSIRIAKPKAAFTIVCIVVDVGYQGLQSSFNSLDDLCAVARIPGYTVTNAYDAKLIIGSQLKTPGFRIIAVSQRLFKQDAWTCTRSIFTDRRHQFIQYAKGTDVTIVCFNFSFPLGVKLMDTLQRRGKTASLFCVNLTEPIAWDRMLHDIGVTKRLVIIDDSKSLHGASAVLAKHAVESCCLKKYLFLKRPFSHTWFRPNPEVFAPDMDHVADQILSSRHISR